MTAVEFTEISSDVLEAIEYLNDGGLMEVLQFAELAGVDQKLETNYTTVVALCVLAAEALNARNKHKLN